MRGLRIPLLLVAVCCSIALAGSSSNVVGISPQSMKLYNEALRDSRSNWRSSLARLESLLLDRHVTVGLDEESIPERAGYLRDSLAEALNIWNDALPDSPFVEARLHETPDVVVRFVRSMPDVPQAQGEIQAERNFYWNSKSHRYTLKATVRVMHTTGRRHLDLDEAAGVIAHELGHLLNLEDRSTAQGLMGFFIPGRAKNRVEPYEVEAINTFRQMLRAQIELIQARSR